MNSTQYENWQHLSQGLARGWSTSLTPARKSKLLAEVERCIDWVVCNGIETIEDWDHAVYLDGRLAYNSAGTRVDNYLFDHRYIVDDRDGERRGRFGDMLAACARAGFDVAVAPSGGVIGFTVGDLRRAFDGPLPDWVTNFFQPPLPEDASEDDGVWL